MLLTPLPPFTYTHLTPPHTYTPTHACKHLTPHTRTHHAGSVELRMVVRGEVSRASVKVSAGKNKNRLVINSVLVELPNGEFLRL